MVPTKKKISIINISIIVVAMILSSLPMWIFVFPISLIKAIIGTSIMIGAVAIGGLIGWLIQRKIYPEIYSTQIRLKTMISETAVIMEEKQIEFELNTDDIIAFFQYSYRHKRYRKLIHYMMMIVSLFWIILAIILFIISGKDLLFFSIVLAILGVLGIVFYLLAPLVINRSINKIVVKTYGKQSNKLTGKHKLSITPEEIIDMTDAGTSSICWDAVENIEYTKQYLFINVRGSGPYIIPQKAFADSKEFNDFIKNIKAYYQTTIKVN